jgi:hypothetical protein
MEVTEKNALLLETFFRVESMLEVLSTLSESSSSFVKEESIKRKERAILALRETEQEYEFGKTN